MGKQSSKASHVVNFTLRGVGEAQITKSGIFFGSGGFMWWYRDAIDNCSFLVRVQVM